MKEREIFSSLRVSSPVFVRVDGRGFRKVLEGLGFEKPYDEGFAAVMVDVTVLFFKAGGFSPVFAYLFSDEVNLFFVELPFKGRVEKVDSVVASFFASALTLRLGLEVPISFDARVVPVALCEVVDYLRWRQDEAWNNHVTSYGYYMLLGQGLKPVEASERLKYLRQGEIHELAFQGGVNLGETPLWQRRGVLVYRGAGGLQVEWSLPLFKEEEGRRLVERLIDV
jgi:tRNA(His) 5'-end guanylyltransferase